MLPEFEKAKKRIRKVLRRMEQPSVVPAVNTLLPQDSEEEPFFIVYDIDWSKYGRDENYRKSVGNN